jgi:predicted negative regulator of RcsB-dependent stress response
MADYSDEETVERLRGWWQENGTTLVIAVVVSVASLLGWRQWQANTAQKAEAASVVYQQMMDSMEQSRGLPATAPQSLQVSALAEQLVESHSSSAYADYARFVLARQAVESNDYEQAVTLLREVMNKPASASIGWTARVRLARVLLHSEDFDGVATVLNASWPQAWHGQAFELRGDLARARGDVVAARDAYRQALNVLEEGGSHRDLVQMKLDDLASAS